MDAAVPDDGLLEEVGAAVTVIVVEGAHHGAPDREEEVRRRLLILQNDLAQRAHAGVMADTRSSVRRRRGGWLR